MHIRIAYDDDDSDVSCTVAEEIIGLNPHLFWGSQSHIDVLGIDNDDGDDNVDVDDDDDMNEYEYNEVGRVDYNLVQEPSSSVEQTASLTDESSVTTACTTASFDGDAIIKKYEEREKRVAINIKNRFDNIASDFQQQQQHIVDPVAGTMARIANAGRIANVGKTWLELNTPVIKGQQINVKSEPFKKRERKRIVSLQRENQHEDHHHQYQRNEASLPASPNAEHIEFKEQQEQNKKQKILSPQLFDDARWNARLVESTEFVKKYKHGRIPTNYPPNPDLASWAKRQRYQYKVYIKQQKPNTNSNVSARQKPTKENRCLMTPERVKALEDINFCWDLQIGLWDCRYEQLREYARSNNGQTCPQKYAHNELWKWVGTQRYQMTLWKRGKPTYLSAERIHKLNSTGFVWESEYPDGSGFEGGDNLPEGKIAENDSQGPYFI